MAHSGEEFRFGDRGRRGLAREILGTRQRRSEFTVQSLRLLLRAHYAFPGSALGRDIPADTDHAHRPPGRIALDTGARAHDSLLAIGTDDAEFGVE